MVIQPYQQSDKEWNMVMISLSNCGGIDAKITYSGLQVEHVELRPMGSDVDNGTFWHSAGKHSDSDYACNVCYSVINRHNNLACI